MRGFQFRSRLISDPLVSSACGRHPAKAPRRTREKTPGTQGNKHSNKLWNCFVMSSIQRALSPVLENFHRRVSWPKWPPLGLRRWAILSLWNFMPLTTQCQAFQVIQQSGAQSNKVSPCWPYRLIIFLNLQRKIQSTEKGVILNRMSWAWKK